MFRSNVKRRYVADDFGRLCQGDILRGVQIPEVVSDGTDVAVDVLNVPYSIVLTQDCDIEQDFNNRAGDTQKHDKFLNYFLVAPIYGLELFKQGRHLAHLELVMESWNSSRISQIKSNNNPRFHYVNPDTELQVPEGVIDFKHYLTIGRELLYLNHRRWRIATLNELFREDLSHRFASFVSRIGTPALDSDSMA